LAIINYPTVHFQLSTENVSSLNKHRHEWRHILYLLAAVSVMFCSRPIQTSPVFEFINSPDTLLQNSETL